MRRFLLSLAARNIISAYFTGKNKRHEDRTPTERIAANIFMKIGRH